MNIKNIKEDGEVEEPKETVDDKEEETEENTEEKPDIPAVPLGPEELDQKELEEKIGEENNDAGEVKTAGVKNFVLGNIKEIDKKSKKPKKKQKPIAELKKIPEPENFLEKAKESWLEPEGQLVIDVYETDSEIVIQSAIAGISPENLDISIEKDMVSIKGKRENTTEKIGKNYFIEECYWGAFSREIILPTEVDAAKAEASMKNGVLTIKAPKIERERKKLTIK
ncbi:MAG: Hsp20/alpha crystallin family protein [Candidatus Nealsonbacteria bacterium]|nr:Hsp20/alpha crystallin family protein [Candidatus Nealsonbacteria bacterium]